MVDLNRYVRNCLSALQWRNAVTRAGECLCQRAPDLRPAFKALSAISVTTLFAKNMPMGYMNDGRKWCGSEQNRGMEVCFVGHF